MFYALKLSSYMGWRYEVFQHEKSAKEAFMKEINRKEFMGWKAVQLFKMKSAITNCKYPIFIPTHKYSDAKNTWVKIKKNYQKEILK